VSVHSFTDTSFSAIRARIRMARLNFLTVLSGGSVRQYRPETHYMRGPGPKWREKHARSREAVSFIQRPVVLSDIGIYR
jgi:hypothetical protein